MGCLGMSRGQRGFGMGLKFEALSAWCLGGSRRGLEPCKLLSERYIVVSINL